MKQTFLILLSISIFIGILGCGPNQEEKQLKEFIRAHVEKVKPLEREANLAYWNASISGNAEDYDRSSKLQLELNQIYSNEKEFLYLKSLKESEQIKDPLLARQLTVLYNTYLPNQIDSVLMEKMVIIYLTS